MEFFDKYWVEFIIGFLGLWTCAKLSNLTTAKDKAEIAVAGLVGKEEWSSFQEITVMRQISIDTSLLRIEYGLGFIMALLMGMAFKLIY